MVEAGIFITIGLVLPADASPDRISRSPARRRSTGCRGGNDGIHQAVHTADSGESAAGSDQGVVGVHVVQQHEVGRVLRIPGVLFGMMYTDGVPVFDDVVSDGDYIAAGIGGDSAATGP